MRLISRPWTKCGLTAARPLLRQHQALALDPRKAADARTDRARRRAAASPRACRSGRHPRCACPAASIAVDDERIDLALDLVVDALAGIEAIFVVGRLHFAGDAALLVAGVETRDRPGAALAREDVLPGRLDVAAQAASRAPDQ